MNVATSRGAARTATPSRVRAGTFAGTGTLLRFMLRRDRVRLPAWLLGITVTMVGTAASLPGLYPDAVARAAAALTIDNPGTIALIGRMYSAEDYTYGAMFGHQTVVLGGVVAALMSILTLVRHTRAEEETGRAELVRAGPVGRNASPAAALVVVLGANAALAVLLTVGLGSVGVESITWSGSWLYGVSLAAVGIVFAAVALVTAQLVEGARAASGLAGLALGLAYGVRAVGDVRDGPWSRLSPLGWVQEARVFDADDGALLLVLLALAVALTLVAVPLIRRRDLGAGLLSARPGRAGASRGLAGPFGLAVRLQRGTLLGWCAGMFAFGLMYGPVLGEADSFLSDLEIMAEFLPEIAGARGSELFGATIIAVAAILCAIPAVQGVLRLRAEENAGRAEPVLATAVSRARWTAAHLLVALIGGGVVLAAFGLGFGLGAAATLEEPGTVLRMLGASFAYLPALWVVAGLGVALFGLAPRATGVAWGLVVFAVVVRYFGELLRLPRWLVDASPFSHVPAMPAADLDVAPLLWLTAVAVVLAVAGLAGVRRRDVAAR